MKKIYVLGAAALLAVSTMQAEKGTIFLYAPDYMQVMGLSPNGKWAAGTLGDGSTVTRGALWNLTTGEITYLSTNDESIAYDVNDEGTVVGAYTDYTVTENGAPVLVPGMYKDGKWSHFDNSTLPGVSISGGEAMSISNDGSVAVGGLYINGKYRPVKWVDGKLSIAFDSEEGCAYTVTEDGTMAAGWSWEQGIMWNEEEQKNDTIDNRAIAYWDENDEKHILSDVPTYLDAGQKFSPDKSKLLCWTFGNQFVYDIPTGERTILPWYSEDAYNIGMFYVSNDGLVLGYEEDQNMMTGNLVTYAYVYDEGETYKMTDWLAEKKGVTVDESDMLLAMGMDMSNDGKVIGVMTYKLQNGVNIGVHSSVVIMMDQEVTYAVPVALSGAKLKGLNDVSLAWKEPLANAGNVLGYNVYRNGTKITPDPIGDMTYCDEVSSEGTYTYTVTAVYEGDADFIESAQSEPCVVEVKADEISRVRGLDGRVKGYNDMQLRWSTPSSNLPEATYFDNTEVISAFGGGQVSFEAAIRIDDYARNYAEDYKIVQVAFMPWNANAHYEIHIYENDVLKYTQPVSDEGLVYHEMNTIDLTTPYTMNAVAKTYVVIAVDASELSVDAYDAIGINYGVCTDGYSDLVRQMTEASFYSLNTTAIEAGITGGMPVSWAISAILGKEEADGSINTDCDKIVAYDVYRDGTLLESVTTTNYLDQQLAEGKYQYGVAVRYADGKESEQESITIDMEPNKDALTKVTNVEVLGEPSFVSATWNAPVNNDENFLTYSSNVPGDPVGASSGSELVEITVAADFTYDRLDWYEGYQISAVRFYPIAEAIFMVVLEENGEDVAIAPVGEMGAADGYNLNQWNTIMLDGPVSIVPGYTYRLKIICSEVDPSVMPISLDDGISIPGVSDLFSSDYSTFESITYNGLSGNWMMGIVVNNGSDEPMAVDGYNVLLDGTQVNTELVTETSFRGNVDYKEGDTHRIKINVVYPVAGEVEGDNVYFEVAPAAVECVTVDRVKVFPNPATSYIRVQGDVTKVELYDMQGRLVATTAAAELDVTALPTGTYLLKAYMGDNEETVKVSVVR